MPYDLPDWIESKIIPEPMSGCWLWMNALDGHGYGRLRLGRHKTLAQCYSAHRFVYEFYNGPIPDDLVIDHLCRNHCCVNPDHMEIVTHQINITRGTAPSAVNFHRTVCVNGHSLENAYLIPSGGRKCRICVGTRAKLRYAAKRDEINAERRHQRKIRNAKNAS